MPAIGNIREQGPVMEYAIQPGSELVYHDTGLIEGSVILKTDLTKGKDELLDKYLGKPHPSDADVFLYAVRRRNLTLNLVEGSFDCIGTRGKKDTERIVVPVPSKEMIPIEAHPKFFTADMAGPESGLTILGDGSYAEGANGARFTVSSNGKITGFLGFIGAAAPQKFRALRFYERNTPILRASWYSWQVPKFSFKSVIVTHPKGAPNYDGIKNWLRSSPPGERVGAVNGEVLWKITQEYIGSEEGVNDVVYDTEAE